MRNELSRLQPLQLGKYAEYLTKMEFIRNGFDVYSAEVDDKGIDFIVRKDRIKYFDIQVKSIRKSTYVFMRKKVFEPRDNLYLALVIFEENQEPTFFLIPSLEWKSRRHSFLVGRDYQNKKSEPEWGIVITRSSSTTLRASFLFDKQIESL